MHGVPVDHTCWWTRRRESELTRDAGALGGAGLPPAALRVAAEYLGQSLSITPDPALEFDETVVIGSWRGTLHDSCFVSFAADDPALRRALVAASLGVHSTYLRAAIATRWVEHLAERLEESTVMRFRSMPGGRALVVRRYRRGAGWLERRRADVTRIPVDAA